MAFQLNQNPFGNFSQVRQTSEDELRRRQEAALMAEEKRNESMLGVQRDTLRSEEALGQAEAQALGNVAQSVSSGVNKYADYQIDKQKSAEERSFKQTQQEEARNFEREKLIADQNFQRPFKEQESADRAKKIGLEEQQLAQQATNQAAENAYREKKLKQDIDIAMKNNASREQIVALQNELKQAQSESKSIATSASSKGMQAVDTDFAKDYNDWTSGGAQAAQSEVSKLKNVAESLKAGKVKTGGVTTGLLPDRLTSNDLLKVRSDVQSTITNSLRAILGTAFTEKEGERIIKNTWNESDSTENNLERINRLVSDLENNMQAKNAKALHFEKQGTLSGLNAAGAQQTQNASQSGSNPAGTTAQPALTDWRTKLKQPMPAQRNP